MSKRVFLHIGLAKSGTSYLQGALSANKAMLAEQVGLLFPGAGWEDQVTAVRDVRWGGDDPEIVGAWARLVDEIAAWPGDSVVSMEWLASAPPRQIRRIIDSLAPASIEVLITVRDLARTIPASWQEHMKNGQVCSWQEYVDVLTSPHSDSPLARKFWQHHDVGRVVARWREVLPVEPIIVITVPPAGSASSVLWDRFSFALGIEAAAVGASGSEENRSLGRESAELMRMLNQVCRDRKLDEATYQQIVKRDVAKHCLASRQPIETPLYRLPLELEDWARVRSRERIDAIAAFNVRVVGDLSDLEIGLWACGGSDTAPTAEAILEAAVDALFAMAKSRSDQLDGSRPASVASASRPAAAALPEEQLLRRARRWVKSQAPRIAKQQRSA